MCSWLWWELIFWVTFVAIGYFLRGFLGVKPAEDAAQVGVDHDPAGRLCATDAEPSSDWCNHHFAFVVGVYVRLRSASMRVCGLIWCRYRSVVLAEEWPSCCWMVIRSTPSAANSDALYVAVREHGPVW